MHVGSFSAGGAAGDKHGDAPHFAIDSSILFRGAHAKAANLVCHRLPAFQAWLSFSTLLHCSRFHSFSLSLYFFFFFFFLRRRTARCTKLAPAPLPACGPSFSLHPARDVFSWRPAGKLSISFLLDFYFIFFFSKLDKWEAPPQQFHKFGTSIGSGSRMSQRRRYLLANAIFFYFFYFHFSDSRSRFKLMLEA